MEIVLTVPEQFKQLSEKQQHAIINGLEQELEKRLQQEPRETFSETALLSEHALADWNHPEEEQAWQHLQ